MTCSNYAKRAADSMLWLSKKKKKKKFWLNSRMLEKTPQSRYAFAEEREKCLSQYDGIYLTVLRSKRCSQ